MMASLVFRDGLLRGQVALVSGGGSGIGRAIALELASLDAQVVICGRREEPLRKTAELGPPGQIECVVCDIREEEQVGMLVDTVLAGHSHIDLLVNNAGGQFLAAAEEVTPKGLRAVMRLNVEGTWLMTHTVATRAMIPGGGGKVVSITLSPHNGMPGMAHSGAARAAVENLMRTLAVEWARYGILCNAIAPGQIATETMLTKYPQQIVEMVAGTVPLGRLGDAREIAWMVAYLASPAGDFTSGSVITIDGARDNWFGTWPPSWGADTEGAPLAEERPG
jgi:NAD(P)-dependent dehydrogenase (short-subunit alcohol dehydrogenase family)